MPIPVTDNPSPRISVVVPPDLLQKAKAHAKETCLPLSTVVRVALAEYIRRNEAATFDDGNGAGSTAAQNKGE